jgi:hypothetical protein
MAITKIDPSKLEFESSNIPVEPEESSLAKLGQFATGIGVKAATAPLRLAESVDQLINYIDPFERGQNTVKFGPERKYPSERIEEAIGEKYTKPENFFSKALQATAGNWPLLFLGGAPTIGKVGADIASSLGMTAAESAGFGPIAQIGASVLGAKGFNKVASALHKNASNPGKIAEFTSKLYEKEKDLGSVIPVGSRQLSQKLRGLHDSIEKRFTDPTKFSDTDKSRLLGNIRNAAEQLAKPNLNASDIFDIKKGLNEIYIPGKSVEGREFNKLRGIFTDELKDIASKHKEWGDTWKYADELYSIGKWQTGLSNYLKDMSSAGRLSKIASNPLTAASLGALGVFFPGGSLRTGIGAASLFGGIKGLEAGKRSFDFINSLSKTKDGQRLLWDIAADSAKGATTELSKSLHKLDKKATEYEKEYPEIVSIDPNQLEFV